MTQHTHSRHAIARLAAAFIGTLAFSAHAVTPAPDAGALLRQNEQNLKLQKPPAAVKRPAPQPAPVVKEAVTTVTVTRFVFAGNTLLSSEVLNAALATYVNRPLNFNDLQAAAAVITGAYVKPVTWPPLPYPSKTSATALSPSKSWRPSLAKLACKPLHHNVCPHNV